MNTQIRCLILPFSQFQISLPFWFVCCCFLTGLYMFLWDWIDSTFFPTYSFSICHFYIPCHYCFFRLQIISTTKLFVFFCSLLNTLYATQLLMSPAHKIASSSFFSDVFSYIPEYGRNYSIYQHTEVQRIFVNPTGTTKTQYKECTSLNINHMLPSFDIFCKKKTCSKYQIYFIFSLSSLSFFTVNFHYTYRCHATTKKEVTLCCVRVISHQYLNMKKENIK